MKTNIILVAAVGLVLSGCGGSTTSPPPPLPPPPPPPPIAQSLTLDVQKTQGPFSVADIGSSLTLTCTPDNAAAVIAWTSTDANVTFGSTSAKSTNVTINGATAREVTITCSNSNNTVTESALIYANRTGEVDYRRSPIFLDGTGNPPAGYTALEDNANPNNCHGETFISLEANLVFYAKAPSGFPFCIAFYDLNDELDDNYDLFYTVRANPADPNVPFLVHEFVVGDVMLEDDKFYNFPVPKAIGGGGFQLAEIINHRLTRH